MARQPRLSVPGIPMHITHRGHNRVATFLDDNDCAVYRELLAFEAGETGCEIHAYALMTNHVHLLVRPQLKYSASHMMQRVASRYVRYFNKRHRRSGTAWEGRFKSALVDSSTYFLACLRYIDLNPVRAGIVASPEQYEWSSYRRLALNEPDRLVTPHEEYLLLGKGRSESAREYRAFCLSKRTNRTIEEIRHATQTGAAFGSRAFQAAMASLLGRRVTRQKRRRRDLVSA